MSTVRCHYVNVKGFKKGIFLKGMSPDGSCIKVDQIGDCDNQPNKNNDSDIQWLLDNFSASNLISFISLFALALSVRRSLSR